MSRTKVGLSAAGLVVLVGVSAVAWSRTRGPSHVADVKFTDTLRIGVVLADPPSRLGATSEAVHQGLVLAQEDLNAEWNDAPHVELVVADSGGSGSTANERVRELAKQGVTCFADVVGSDVLAGCVATVREKKLVVLTAVDASPQLPMLLGSSFFRAAPSDVSVVRELLSWVRELGGEHPVLVVNEGEEGDLLKGAFIQACRGTCADRVLTIAPGQVGPQRVAERIVKLSPDALLLLIPAEDSAEVAAGLQASGATTRVFGTQRSLDAALLKKSAASLLTRTFVLAPKEADAPPRRAVVAEEWRQRFGAKATGAASAQVFAAYDALQVLARAARETRCDPVKTAARLRTVDYDGTTGRVAFDENGERRGPPTQRRVLTEQGVLIPYAAENFVSPGTTR